MNWKIDAGKKEAAYLQLYHQIREEIVRNVLPPGTRLPSKRTMAEELGISVITVEHALELLSDEAYITSRPRSGFYVSFGGLKQNTMRRPAALSEMQAPTDVPPDFPFSLWAKTMRSVLSEYGERILSSAPGTGCPELKNAIAGWMARSRGLLLDPERILIGSGAEYLYGLTVQLLGRDRLFALEDPCYEKIRQVYEANGAVCESLRMGPDGILTEELQRSRAALLHVTPYHRYPSGVTASAAKRHEYTAWAQKRLELAEQDPHIQGYADGVFWERNTAALMKKHRKT